MSSPEARRPVEIPALLADDEEHARRRFMALAADAEATLGIRLRITEADDCHRARQELALGIYPLAFVDLAMPEPYVGAGDALSPYPGLEVLDYARSHNKDCLTAAFTAFGAHTAMELVGVRTAGLLDKSSTRARLRKALEPLVLGALARYNFRLDVETESALRLAFDGAPPHGRPDQWTACLRRILRAADSSVRYEQLSKGLSGAGILALYADDHLPTVLKLHRFRDLRDEATRYDRFVSSYIPRRAVTSMDDLAQAGDVGILSYSFVGLSDRPRTFGWTVTHESPTAAAAAIKDHFQSSCARWFASAGVFEPGDLAESCRAFWQPTPASWPDPVGDDTFGWAATAVAAALGSTTPRALIDEITDATQAARRRVACQLPVIVHGDLNINNLIWDGAELWMIDFAKTTDGQSRMTDFVRLEASIKYHMPDDFAERVSEDERVAAMIQAEDGLLASLRLGPVSGDEAASLFTRQQAAIRAIRECAWGQCGPTPEDEYWTALFYITVKHVEYLLRDIAAGKDAQFRLSRALYSAARLAQKLEPTVV